MFNLKSVCCQQKKLPAILQSCKDREKKKSSETQSKKYLSTRKWEVFYRFPHAHSCSNSQRDCPQNSKKWSHNHCWVKWDTDMCLTWMCLLTLGLLVTISAMIITPMLSTQLVMWVLTNTSRQMSVWTTKMVFGQSHSRQCVELWRGRTEENCLVQRAMWQELKTWTRWKSLLTDFLLSLSFLQSESQNPIKHHSGCPWKNLETIFDPMLSVFKTSLKSLNIAL